MRNKSHDIAIQFQTLNQVLRDEVATLREELALQKLQTAVALMQLANKTAQEARENSLHQVPNY